MTEEDFDVLMVEGLKGWFEDKGVGDRTLLQVLAELFAKNRCEIRVTGWGDTYPEPNHPYGRYGLTQVEALMLVQMAGAIEVFVRLSPRLSAVIHEAIKGEIRRVAATKHAADFSTPDLTNDLFVKDNLCPPSTKSGDEPSSTESPTTPTTG